MELLRRSRVTREAVLKEEANDFVGFEAAAGGRRERKTRFFTRGSVFIHFAIGGRNRICRNVLSFKNFFQ